MLNLSFRKAQFFFTKMTVTMDLVNVISRLSARRIDLVLILVAVVWGGSYLAAKELTEQASVMVVLGLRFAVAFVALLTVWLVMRENCRLAANGWSVGFWG